MAYLYQPSHPSILRALQQVFAAVARIGGSVSVCGDMPLLSEDSRQSSPSFFLLRPPACFVNLAL
jgi:hypothetical protein